MIQKLLRQFGEHGNDYSPVEMGDKINEIIDFLFPIQIITKQIETVNSEPNTDLLKEYPVRSASTADRVYLIKDGKKHWIKNPETLAKLGFKFSDVKSIKNEEMAKFETGEAINLKEPVISEVPTTKEDGDTYNL